MTPKNFPERRNARRQVAYAAICRYLAEPEGTVKRTTAQLVAEATVLESRIVASARDVRTKRDRSARGKVTR